MSQSHTYDRIDMHGVTIPKEVLFLLMKIPQF